MIHKCPYCRRIVFLVILGNPEVNNYTRPNWHILLIVFGGACSYGPPTTRSRERISDCLSEPVGSVTSIRNLLTLNNPIFGQA